MPTQVVRPGRRAGNAAIAAAVSMCAIGMMAGLSPTAGASTIRDDRTSDTFYTTPAAQYTPVGAIGAAGASGILITPKWVLSAAHVTSLGSVFNFNIGGSTSTNGTGYAEAYHFSHPSWTGNLSAGFDMGLVRLGSPVTGYTPADRLFDTSDADLHAKGVSVGYGISGNGTSGVNAGSLSLPYGTKHAIENDLDVKGDYFAGYSPNLLLADFDKPGDPSLNHLGTAGVVKDKEGSIASGDSGGGTFIQINGRYYVAGVHSFIAQYDGLADASYGDLFGVTRVSAFNLWIDQNIVNYWNTASGGTFGDSGKWTLGTGSLATNINPTAGDIAGFNQGGNYTINFTAPPAANHQLLALSGNVTLELGGQTYNLTSTMGEGGIVVGRYSGNNASVTFASGTVSSHDAIIAQMAGSSGRITVGNGATWNLTGDAYVGGSHFSNGGNGTLAIQSSTSSLNITGALRVHSAGTVNYNAGTLSVATLDIKSGGKVLLSSGQNKVLQTKSVSIIGVGKLDLSDNDMIVNYDGASPIDTIRGYLAAGFNGGNWAGNGITSSSAGALRLGYGEAAALGIDWFDGIGVDDTSVLLKLTVPGDTNLDGMVDATDLGALASSWQGAGLWNTGDFNYDGVVNITDLTALANHWLSGAPAAPLGAPLSMSAVMASFGLTPSSVPEPASLALLGICLAGAIGLRRRGRN